jgi:4-hydroxy-tetrahydrodipicolinate synthase
MTGFAYPDMLVRIYGRFVAGDADGAEDQFDCYLPVLYYEQPPGCGLAVRKEILRRRGAIASATFRPPGSTLGAADRAELERLRARLAHRLGDG